MKNRKVALETMGVSQDKWEGIQVLVRNDPNRRDDSQSKETSESLHGSHLVSRTAATVVVAVMTLR